MARVPRPITEIYLQRVTGHYLERYSANRAHLQRLLMRRVERSARHHGEDPPEVDALRAQGTAHVLAELDRLEAIGLLDDAQFAEDKARTLHRRGSSRRRIRSVLGGRGIAGHVVDEAIEALSESGGNAELAAACTFARKRRIGPWRGASADVDRRRKELARMARAGFSYELARRVVEASDVDNLEAEALEDPSG